MKVMVIGTGYVGYPMALLMAKAGFEVVGVDIDPETVRRINNAEAILPEPGLRDLAGDPEVRGRLRASAHPEVGDVFMICVPTPLMKPRKAADMSMVIEAASAIVPFLRTGNLVVLESTVPPRSCREVLLPILERGGLRVGPDVLLAHCPERVLPGKALAEIADNARIIGGIDERSTEAAADVYSRFVRGRIIRTDDVTAELCKLMENTYRDVNIALANELSRVCRTLGVDANRAISIANLHPRVNILQPGIGVGGHCIPIDPWFIAEVDPESCRLIPTARQINDAQPDQIAGFIRREVREISDPTIVCLGATYKAGIYDLRESPALCVAQMLRDDGYNTRVFDPITTEFGTQPIQEALRGAHLGVILVPHETMLQEIREKRAVITGVMARDRIVDVSTSNIVRM